MNSQYSHDEASVLRGIATTQKKLMICVLLGVFHFISITAIGPIAFGSSSEPSGFGEALLLGWFFAGFVLLVFYLVLVGRLNSLLGKSAAERIGFALLIVLVNLLAVLVVNSQATKRLKQAGLKVGFLGADTHELDDKLKQPQN
jgi:hypothetical protein